MTKGAMTRRSLLGLGTSAGLACLGGLAFPGCGGGDNHTIDPDIYDDPVRDAVPAERVIRKIDSFRGRRPNIILILCDDMGYGDLSCYGSRAIATPNIDGMARQGVRFTDYYCASPLCSPSRAGLLTGRYPLRTGIVFPLQPGKDTFMRKLVREAGYLMGSLGVLDLNGASNMVKGLPLSEITIAEALKVAGYRTAAVGKWHLGDFTTDMKYHPHRHGFDHFAGFPASNDDWPAAYWVNEKQITDDIALNQEMYTGIFTDEAVKFIEGSGGNPFFLYLAHKDPHQPCFPSRRFQGMSKGGPHGDAVSEVDWSTGVILDTLRRRGLDRDTLVIFTSDNGPWFDGSSGGLRGRKGESFDGGFRVPLVARWPGTIPAGRESREPAMGIDIFPTVMELAGLTLPSDRIIDGRSIRGLLAGRGGGPVRDGIYFFHYRDIEGVRSGNWKYFQRVNTRAWPVPLDRPDTLFGSAAAGHDYRPPGSDTAVPTLATWPLLYNLDTDPGESYNLMKRHPGVGEELRAKLEHFERAFFSNVRGWTS